MEIAAGVGGGSAVHSWSPYVTVRRHASLCVAACGRVPPPGGFESSRALVGKQEPLHGLPEMTKRVLIVDDSRVTRRVIARLVQRQGHETLEAENGKVGLALAADEAPDCILLDILMPEMDGIAFLKEAEEQGLTIPVIVMSADAQRPDRARQLLELGARAVVDKPPQGEAPMLQALAATLAR